MSDSYEIDPITAELVTRNIGLIGQMLQEILNDPVILDEIPQDAMVIVMPVDDPELAAQNLAMAAQLQTAERELRFYTVGQSQPKQQAVETRHLIER